MVLVALYIAYTGIGCENRVVARFVNTIAELLEVASQLAAVAKPGSNGQKWFLVRAFL